MTDARTTLTDIKEVLHDWREIEANEEILYILEGHFTVFVKRWDDGYFLFVVNFFSNGGNPQALVGALLEATHKRVEVGRSKLAIETNLENVAQGAVAALSCGLQLVCAGKEARCKPDDPIRLKILESTIVAQE